MDQEQVTRFVSDIKALQKQLERRQLALFKRLVQHLEYHKKYEARWGLVKIMRDHPFHTISMGITLGIILTLIYGNEVKELFALFIKVVF